MRSLIACFALLVGFLASGLLVHAQDSRPTDKTDGSTSANASEAEVNELRSEVEAQRKTIEELKAMVGKLVEAKTAPDNNPASIHVVTDSSSGSTSPQLVNAVIVQPYGAEESALVDMRNAERQRMCRRLC
jgi:hypothetical protein